MLRIIQNIFTKQYHRFWVTVGAWAMVALYVGTIPIAAKKGGDFVHLWIGGHLVATGQMAQLYAPPVHKAIVTALNLPLSDYWGARYDILGVFFYPPLTGLLYAPLGALPLYWAQATQAAINIGLGVCSAWLLSRILAGRLRFATVLILFFTFPSFFYAYSLGQNGIFTTTLVLASWYLWQRGAAWQAGAAVSLLAYKPNWLLAIGWIPLVQRRWRVLVGIGGGLLFLLFFMVSVMGLTPLRTYLEIFVELTDLHDLPNYPLSIQYSLLSLFRRYLGMSSAASLLGWGLALLIMAMSAWCIQRPHIGKRANGAFSLSAMALSWVAAVCLNPHLHHYDLTLVGAAMIVALSEWRELSHLHRWLLGGLFVFNHLAFVVSNFFAINETLPLPIFAMLAAWGWLLFRAHVTRGRRARATKREERQLESYAAQMA
ncbi:MAG: glycosyltransferase family 87 protein [Caldilineaceae bacterium]